MPQSTIRFGRPALKRDDPDFIASVIAAHVLGGSGNMTSRLFREVREKRDPIEHFGQKLLKNGVMSEDDLKMLDKDVRAIVTQAAEFATESPEPGPAELYTDVLA